MLAVAALGLGAPPDASAAVWGSFDATRIAYITGALTGDVHSQFRDVITDHGDAVGDPTGALTAEYMAGIDVFYTAMLSDGTGPTAGNPGTLSPDEQMALQDWVAGGGTLIVNADSNGFDGPFAMVYDSWLSDYGVTAFAFEFDIGTGMPTGTPHPITEGVSLYFMDGVTTFSYGVDATLLGTAFAPEQPFLLVLEPDSGFTDGGRILVISDHNALTNNYIGDNDNLVLAQNIVEWAAGECGNGNIESGEECDDGNTDPGDGCDEACLNEGGGSGGSSGGSGMDETGDSGAPDTGAGSTGTPGDGSTTAPADSGPAEGSTGAGGSTGGTMDGGADGGAADGGEEGCGCTTAPREVPWLSLGLMGLVLGAGRRRVRTLGDRR